MVPLLSTTTTLAAAALWLGGASGVLGIPSSSSSSSHINNIGVSSAAPVVVATAKNGSYSGTYSRQWNQDYFLGLPYAQRFSVAQPLNTTWTDVRPATQYPPFCPGYGGDNKNYTESEDCLYLNVIRPHNTPPSAGLPVAVWIHGGGLFMGGSADIRYNLSFIVDNSVQLNTPMIAVSLNYRVSAFGFPVGREAMAQGVTNLGFRDQRLALAWVNENIQAFGGDPKKVTLWGESSGAESLSAQVLAYNGRDDGLFRGAMAESGFGGVLERYPGVLNATEDMQTAYDTLVGRTSCAGNASDTLGCLRGLPFSEIDAALNETDLGQQPLGQGRWPPVLDGDFIADHPSNQLRDGRFVRVPVLIGTNTDEGTAFESGFSNGSKVDTDADIAAAIRNIIGPDATKQTGKTVDELVGELMYTYPNIEAIGIPGLDKFGVIKGNTTLADMVGLQYRRAGAVFGDFMMQYMRRRANLAWSQYGVPSWSYRFDVVVNGVPAIVGATHFQEVAFVFYNLGGDGYFQANPFDVENNKEFAALAKTMSDAWVSFVTNQDPNPRISRGNKSLQWPKYDPASGGGVGSNMVFSVNGDQVCGQKGSYVEADSWRAEGINWMIENALSVFGN
ncbi:hypothetical protein QBC46DRAFT_455519 [Diplogelasinospora grovesii]|uniref:Carboxylic ester hydrolase n=1 Tax=Diplogelasinospora grovesii TaxID=303347 RepID=A0AAN6S9E6_9PEZI|nr:hypothetical protein QBC46DRAFT_455519 [Diplogelasinospora grovesii]